MAGVSTRKTYAGRTEVNIQDPVCYYGSFEVDGNDADPVNVRGEGFLVTHSGDNDYLITFPEKYPMLISFLATAEADAAGSANADDVSAVNEPYVALSGTLTVRVSVGQTKSDLENGQRINFCAVFHRTSALSVTHA